MNRQLILSAVITAMALAGGYGMRVLAEGAPTTQPLFYSGTLEDNGMPADGNYTVILGLYDKETKGTELCKNESEPVDVKAGRFRVQVDDACVAELKANPDVWVSVGFKDPNGASHDIPGRTKIGAVPYALEAQHAVTASAASSAAGALETRIASIEAAASNRSGFRAHSNSNQPVASDAVDTVAFGSEDFDFAGEYSNLTNTFTTVDGGYYEIGCHLRWEIPSPGTSMGYWMTKVMVNGIEAPQDGRRGDGEFLMLNARGLVKLAPGSAVTCLAHQTSGNAQSLQAGYASFDAIRVAPLD